MRPFVFAGPSLFGIDLSTIDFEFRPPAASGDILAAVRDGARVIGLIDGLYNDCAAVWHKEILHALSEGVAVAGAASMGALRAAECCTFGMVGVGTIFEDYRDGQRVSDADVAVTHAPADLNYQPISIALVDAEATIEHSAPSFGTQDTLALIHAARKIHFSSRTWRSIVSLAGLGTDHLVHLQANPVSLKRRDACRLIDTLKQGDIPSTQTRSWKFQNTIFFQSMLHRQLSTDGDH